MKTWTQNSDRMHTCSNKKTRYSSDSTATTKLSQHLLAKKIKSKIKLLLKSLDQRQLTDICNEEID